MGKILVVEPEVSGHRLEYYHHIYMAAVKDKCNQYIFVFSADFRKQQSRFDWPRTGNIRIVILSEQQTMLLRGNIVKLTWKRSIFLIRLIRKYHPDKIFLLEAIFYLPYVPIFLALVYSSIEVNGIVFLVYTYRWKRQGYVRKILDVVKFWLMAKCLDSACGQRFGLCVPCGLHPEGRLCLHQRTPSGFEELQSLHGSQRYRFDEP